MIRQTAAMACVWLAAAVGAARAAPPDAVAQLAPGGAMHVAINYGNPVLAQRNPPAGAPHGVSAELARELGRQLGAPVVFVPFDEAGQVSATATSKVWDVAFLAVDPVRATDIAFTAPYVLIEGTYVVPSASGLRSIQDVDHPGLRIAVAKGSAYDLFLTRSLTAAQLVREPDSAAAMAMLDQPDIAAVAGVKQPLVAFAAAHEGVRVIPGRFMVIAQAMAIPRGRPAALTFLDTFVEEMKASGFVARALAASGQADAEVAPAMAAGKSPPAR